MSVVASPGSIAFVLVLSSDLVGLAASVGSSHSGVVSGAAALVSCLCELRCTSCGMASWSVAVASLGGSAVLASASAVPVGLDVVEALSSSNSESVVIAASVAAVPGDYSFVCGRAGVGSTAVVGVSPVGGGAGLAGIAVSAVVVRSSRVSDLNTLVMSIDAFLIWTASAKGVAVGMVNAATGVPSG